MKHTLASLAAQVGGTVEGNGEKEISGVAGLPEAGPHQISLMSGSRYLKELAHGLRLLPQECNQIHAKYNAPQIFR